MPDLGRTVRALAKKVAGGGEKKIDEGVATALDGRRAVAAAEALLGAVPAPALASATAGDADLSASLSPSKSGVRFETAGARAALSTAVGEALGGLRATTFVDAPGLEANLDLLADAASRRLPLVVHVALRADARSAGGGHRGWYAAAAGGAVQLLAGSVQEAADLTFVARRVAEEALVPVLVGMDLETASGVEDLRLPSPATVAAFLGAPDDVVHAASPSQEMLLGRHRRRLPRWHDVSRPLTGGALAGPEHLAAQAARRAYLDPHAAEALHGACAAWRELTGRTVAPLARHGAAGARVVLVASGATTATVAALAASGAPGLVGELLGGGRRLAVLGLAALRPLPAEAMALALDGAEVVVVLERSDAPLDDEGPLTREVRAVVARMPVSRRPEVATVVHALGGAPLHAAVLAELCRRCRRSPHELLGPPRYLGVDLAPAADAWPKRQVVLDALRRAYPQAAALGLAGRGAAPELRPPCAFTIAFHRRGGDGRGLVADAAETLHRFAGGHLRTRAASGWDAWGEAAVDRLTWAPAPFAEPGDDVRPEVAVWTAAGAPGAAAMAGLATGGVLLFEKPETGWQRPPAPEVVRAAVAGRVSLHALPAGDGTDVRMDAALRRERLLGALLAVLAATGRLEVKARKLLEARRALLAGRGLDAAEVERCLTALQAGFDRTHAVPRSDLDAMPAVPAEEPAVPAALRRAGAGSGTVDSLSSFRDEVLVPAAVSPPLDSAVSRGASPASPAGLADRRAPGGEPPQSPRVAPPAGSAVTERGVAARGEPLPTPRLACGALPAGSAALLSTAVGRTMLPALDAAACTGCGACWTACPDGALAPLVIAPAALLERGMARAAAAGAGVDALRMVAGKVAANAGKELEGRKAADAGDLFAAAFDATLAKTKLPEDRLQAVREAFAAVRVELTGLPVVRTEPFFDLAEAASEGSGELFSLAIDPDACKGCGLCVAACEPGALAAAADTPKRTRQARALWRFAEELSAPSPATVSASASSIGRLAAALLDPAARGVLAGAGGAESGSGEGLAVRLALGAAVAELAPRRAELLARLDAAAEELAQAIQGGLARALPSRDLDALSRGLASLDRPEAELADLAARVETAFESERVDVPRLRHLVDAARGLADLRWRLAEGGSGARGTGAGRALLSVVAGPGPIAAWAGAFPSAPFTVPVTVCTAGDAAALARGVLAGQAAQALDGLRALRRARLELDAGAGNYSEQRLEEEVAGLARLSWPDLDAGERALVPPLFLVAGEEELLASSLPGLLALLGGDLPVKVLLLAEGQLGIDGGGLDAGLLALVPPRAFVAQSSIAFGDHLAAAVAAALDAEAPALVRVHAPSPSWHGFAPEATLARAREAVAARVWPLWTAAPAEAAGGERVLDLAGNPEGDDASVAEWALGEERFATYFAPYRESDGEAVELRRYLELPRTDRQGKVAVVETPERGRLRVAAPLVAAAEARRAAWRALQARAAAATAEPAAATAAEVAARERAHQAELAALRAEGEARLAAARGESRVELAQQVRRRLLALALRTAPPAAGEPRPEDLPS